jgi:hypothetical protein
MKNWMFLFCFLIGSMAFAKPVVTAHCNGYFGQTDFKTDLVFGDGTPDKKPLGKYKGVTYSLQLGSSGSSTTLMIASEVIEPDGAIDIALSDYSSAIGAKQIRYIGNTRSVLVICSLQ